jgi:hypothetical protein
MLNWSRRCPDTCASAAATTLRVLLGAVYGSLTGLRWQQEVGGPQVRVVTGEGRVLGLRLADAMVLEVNEDGKIAKICPHLRPWLATTVFAIVIAAKVLPHPGVPRRAWGQT